jgi:hypothetical protein
MSSDRPIDERRSPSAFESEVPVQVIDFGVDGIQSHDGILALHPVGNGLQSYSVVTHGRDSAILLVISA